MHKLSQGQKRRARRAALEAARRAQARAEIRSSREAAAEVGAKVKALIDPNTGIVTGTIISPSYRDGAAQFQDCATVYDSAPTWGGWEERESLPTTRRGRKVQPGVDYVAVPIEGGYRVQWLFGAKGPKARVLTNVRSK